MTGVQTCALPILLALEKVGPDRFLKTLRTAGVEPGVAKDEVRTSLGIALGSASISPLELAGLYSGLANGGRFAPPSVRRDRPRAEPVRLIGPAAAWYVADILSDAPLPEGFAALPPALRERRIAYKTGTSAGFRDAWAAGYSANWTVVVWVGHPDGTSRAGQLGRLSALPTVFKAFDRLPGEDNRAAPPGADVLRVSSWHDLPPRMRTLGPTGPSDAGLRIEYFKDNLYGRTYAVPSAHPAVDWTGPGGHPYLGYLIRFGRWTVYHAGDCVPYPELVNRLRPYNVSVAILPIGGNNFSISEAAQLAEDIDAKWVVPMHYGTFGEDRESDFVAHMLGHRPDLRFRVLHEAPDERTAQGLEARRSDREVAQSHDSGALGL